MKLALCFTRAMSLEMWLDGGLFSREKAIYEIHLRNENLDAVHWMTYGRRDEIIARQLKSDGKLDTRIHVHGLPSWFPSGKIGCLLYSFLLPFYHWRVFRSVDLIKTNQLDGGWAAVFGKLIYKKPLILRCGFIQSQLEEALKRLPNWRVQLMHLTERFQYAFADLAIVSSEHNSEYIQTNYKFPKACARVVPNFIDVDLFAPRENLHKKSERILFVGRLSDEKNIKSLISAVAIGGLSLDIIGQGHLRDALQSFAKKIGADVKFLGVCPNAELPSKINQYRYYALTSFFEGSPKTLLEAMACGLVCVGTNTTGISEVIEDGENGFLAFGFDEESISTALRRAIECDYFSLGKCARETIEQKYSLEKMAANEQVIFEDFI